MKFKNVAKLISTFCLGALVVSCSNDNEKVINSSKANNLEKQKIEEPSQYDYSNESRSAERMSEEESEAFFRYHIAIFDARVRSLNSKKFVREVYLPNFSDESWDKISVGFEGYLFYDDGRGNDLVANDQIFTSVEAFPYNERVVYDPKTPLKSVMKETIVSVEFQHHDELSELYETYGLRKAGGGIHVNVDCGSIEFCSDGCLADWIWDGFGCICLSDCSFSAGFELGW